MQTYPANSAHLCPGRYASQTLRIFQRRTFYGTTNTDPGNSCGQIRRIFVLFHFFFFACIKCDAPHLITNLSSSWLPNPASAVMSRHQAYRNYDYENDLDEYDGEEFDDGEEEMTSEDRGKPTELSLRAIYIA